jgi:hypothetical protein
MHTVNEEALCKDTHHGTVARGTEGQRLPVWTKSEKLYFVSIFCILSQIFV